MPSASDIATATRLMADFAARTGLGSDAPDDRYLWTDAFATCNFRGLAACGGGIEFETLALRTVEHVHRTLGHQRADARDSGWLQGAYGAASAEHPTRAGLRIGKPLPERGPGERVDERLEWERDGQYFHYLTRWMHALDQLARATRNRQLNLWARELADTAHRAFTYTAPGGARRMFWKMSVDLSRPLVASMGQHDPLDGYVCVLALQATARALGATGGPGLGGAAADFAAMLRDGNWATSDPLGLGGLLMDACRLEQLIREHALEESALLDRMLESALLGLHHYRPQEHAPAHHRLAFRELGLAIGLSAVERMAGRTREGASASAASTASLVEALARHTPLGERITAFWLQPAHRGASSWTAHRNINDVMLATSLVPDGWLLLPGMG